MPALSKVEGAAAPQPPQWSRLSTSRSSGQRLPLACAFACAAVGAVGIVAYHAGWPLALTWHLGFTPLHYNTAVLLLLAGAALAAALRGRRVLAVGLTLLVAVGAGAIGANELFSLHLGLNSALFPVPAAAPAMAATRVAPNTAVALLLAGLGIFLAAILRPIPLRGAVSLAAGEVVTVLAAVAIFGYIFSIGEAYRWREYTAMSLPAAAALALLGSGVLSVGRAQMRQEQRSGLSLLTVTLGIALPTAALLLWQALDWERDQAQRASVLPEMVLALSLVISALGVLSIFLAQVARTRNRQLAEQQFYTRSLIEASLDPLVTINPEGKITDVSQATERVTGRTREQLIGSDFTEYFSDPETARAGYRQVFAEGAVQDYPLAICHAGGHLTEVLYNATVYRNRSGEIVGVFAAARDVTALKRAEGELQHYAQQLERSNAELQDFASIASHDLQEPLRKVLAFGDRLREHSASALDDTGQDYLRRMQNAAGRMSQLIQSLLEYSRITSRAQPFQRVDLAQVLFEIVSDLDERIRAGGARIISDVLPVINADPTQMRQLLQNLLANALKFQRPAQKPVIEVSTRRTESGEWEITVRDNGIGFDEQYAERIFRPFQRLHGRQQYEGSGMGLAICRKIVQRHGGTLVAHSTSGQGSEFVITLPGAELRTADPQPHEVRSSPLAIRPQRSESWSEHKSA